MKKIVVISGSPRKKGYTMSIVKIIEDMMKKVDESIEFKYVYLRDKNLKFCLGCMNCLKVGGNACPRKDDASMILEEMHSADGLIFASPGYSHQVSGLYKNFMDRFMYLDHLPEFVGVPALIVSTVGGDGAGVIPKYMANMGITWWGCEIVGQMGIPFLYFKISNKYHKKMMKKIETTAVDFYNELNNNIPKRPSFKQYWCFRFNKMETVSNIEGCPGRYKFWKSRGWIEADYYYDTKVKLIYKIICSLMINYFVMMLKMDLGKDYKEKIAEWTKTW